MPVTVQHPEYGIIEFPDGYSESQINNALINLDAREGEQYGIGETLYRSAERGFTSTARGIEQGLTGEIADGALTSVSDAEAERELRIMLEQNPLAGYSGLLLGSLADPVTLPFAWTKLIKSGNIIKQATTRGAAGGATGGLLEPVYEDYGDSRVLNIMAGGGLGAGVGAVAGKVIQRFQEGPKVDVEDAGEGEVTIPQSVREDGRLKDEVFSAIEDTELAAVEARVGQRLADANAIEDVQELAEALPKRQLADVPEPQARTFNPIAKLEEELVPLAAKALPRAETQTLQRSLDAVDNELNKAKQVAERRSSVAAKARAQETVNKIQTRRDKIAKQVNEAREGAKAQRYINQIKAGRIEQLPNAQKARLAELQQEAGANINEVAQVARQRQAELPAPVEQAVSEINTRVAQRINPIEYKPVVARDGAVQRTPAPLGLDPRAGVGSTGTHPSQRFAATATDAPGEQAVERAVFGRQDVPVPDRAEVTGATEPEFNFHSRLQAASSEQLIRLRNENVYSGGRYSWNNVVDAAVEVEGRILNDYDDLADWLAENDENIFKAAELEAIAPLIQEAQQRMFDSRKILYALRREDRLDTEEAVRVMQDIQYYNYIGNAGYIAQKTKISNAMSQLRKMKRYLNVQEGDLERGKQINQIMFGVRC